MPDQTTLCPPVFDVRNLRQRVLSAVLLLPVVLAATYWGGWVFWGVLLCAAMLGLREWLRLVDPMAKTAVVAFAYAVLVLTMLAGMVFGAPLAAMLGTFLSLVLFLIAARDHAERAVWVTLGIPYMAGFGLSLLFIRNTPDHGMAMLLYVFAVVWGTDIGAFLAGRVFGGPKLAPMISPSKTWSGLIGGMVLAALFAYGVAVAYGARECLILAGLALILAPVAQVGDLFESHIKRRSGVKESGGLIPGHGGILDRIDGLIFAAIFFVMFETALGNFVIWW